MFEFTIPEINNIDPENIIVEKEIPIEKPPLLGANVPFQGIYLYLLCPKLPFWLFENSTAVHLHGRVHGS